MNFLSLIILKTLFLHSIFSVKIVYIDPSINCGENCFGSEEAPYNNLIAAIAQIENSIPVDNKIIFLLSFS